MDSLHFMEASLDEIVKGLGIATLVIGLCVRSAISFAVTLGTNFNRKERIFVSLTWLSKGTVQAAIGGMAFDRAVELNDPDKEVVRLSLDIITLSVLAIVICAPLGATCIALLGPKFLSKGEFSAASDGEIEVKVCDGEKELTNGKTSIQDDIFKEEQRAKDTHYNLNMSEASTASLTSIESENENIQSNGHTSQTMVSYAEILLAQVPECEDDRDTCNISRKISVTLINDPAPNSSPQHKL